MISSMLALIAMTFVASEVVIPVEPPPLGIAPIQILFVYCQDRPEEPGLPAMTPGLEYCEEA